MTTAAILHVLLTDELDGKDVNGPDSFYKVYEPVFERNKRFAVILPAPSLGNDDTPIDEVRHFCTVKEARFSPGYHVYLPSRLLKVVALIATSSHHKVKRWTPFRSEHFQHTHVGKLFLDVS